MIFRKKGQMSFFIIIGIVLIIITALIISMRGGLVKREAETEAKKAGEQAFETKEIENYVIGCLRKTAENALDLLGKQGGKIYTNQKGPKGMRDINDVNEGKPPFFVWNCYGKDNNRVDCQSTDTETQYIVPYLVIYDSGTNKFTDHDFYEIEMGGTTNPQQTMEFNLKTFIENNIDEQPDGCLYIRPEFPGFELALDQTKKEAHITIAEEDIKIELDYPIKITDLATGEISELNSFSASVNVRLKKIHQFVEGYIQSKIQGREPVPSSDGIEAVDGIDAKKGDLTVIRDKIVKVSDTKSIFKGGHYPFWFIVEDPFLCNEYILLFTCADDNEDQFGRECLWSGGYSICETCCGIECALNWDDTARIYYKNDGTQNTIQAAVDDHICSPDCNALFDDDEEMCKKAGCKRSGDQCNAECASGWVDDGTAGDIQHDGICSLNCKDAQWDAQASCIDTNQCLWTPSSSACGNNCGCDAVCLDGYKDINKVCEINCDDTHWDVGSIACPDGCKSIPYSSANKCAAACPAGYTESDNNCVVDCSDPPTGVLNDQTNCLAASCYWVPDTTQYCSNSCPTGYQDTDSDNKCEAIDSCNTVGDPITTPCNCGTSLCSTGYCCGTTCQDTACTGTIVGLVKDLSGAIILGASISTDQGQSTTQPVATQYTLANVPAGPIRLTVTATNYQTQTRDVTLTSTGLTEDFTLNPS